MARRDADDAEDDDAAPMHIVAVERLTSVGDWEMYRLVDRDAGKTIASLGLETPVDAARRVAYALWFPEDVDEPGRRGVVELVGPVSAGAGWDDAAREAALRKTLVKERRALERDPSGATFHLASRTGSPEDIEAGAEVGRGDDREGGRVG